MLGKITFKVNRLLKFVLFNQKTINLEKKINKEVEIEKQEKRKCSIILRSLTAN